MVFVEKTLEEMFEQIEFSEFGIYETLIPEEEFPIDVKTGLVLNFSYKKRLDQHIFGYVPNLITRLQSTPKFSSRRNPEFSVKSNISSAICYAIENALTRGNNYPFPPKVDRRQTEEDWPRSNGHLPITIKTFIGTSGIIVRIRDSGRGFDYRTEIKRCRGENPHYGSVHIMESSVSEVSYEGNGSIVNILIKNK